MQSESSTGVKNNNIVTVEDEKLIGADCSDLAEETQMKLIEGNTNPEITFEFLGSVYAESTAACFLKVKIQNAAPGVDDSYSLFNLVSGKTYRIFDSLESMNAALETM